MPEIALTPQTIDALSRALRRHRRAASLAARRRASATTSGARLRAGEARVCVGPRSAVFAPVARPGPDRRRRGARLRLQAGVRPALRRAPGRPSPRGRRGGRARLRHRDAAPRELARPRAPRPSRPRRRPLAAAGRASSTCASRTRARGRCTLPRPPPCERSRRAASKAIVLLNRRGWSPHLSCRSCGHTWSCEECDVSLVTHRHVGRLACHHCGHVEAVPESCPRLRLGDPRARRRRHRAHRGRDRAPRRSRRGHAPRLRQRRRGGLTPGDPAPLPGGALGRSRRDPDGRQGPRLLRRLAQRDPRRRRDAALPRLPRRGAHLRAGRAARREEREGGGRRPRPRADARAPGRADPRRRPPRLDRLRHRRARAPPRARLPAVLPPGAHRAGRRRRPRRLPRRARRARRARGRDPGGHRAARPRPAACACAAATAASSCSRAPTARRPTRPCARSWSACSTERALGDSSISVDIDPQ